MLREPQASLAPGQQLNVLGFEGNVLPLGTSHVALETSPEGDEPTALRMRTRKCRR